MKQQEVFKAMADPTRRAILKRLQGGALSAGEIGADADGLERLLRYASARGFVGMDRRGRFFATPVTEVLRRTHRNSWRGWVEFAGSDWFWAALRHLDARLLEGRSGMEAAHGADFFTFVNERFQRLLGFDRDELLGSHYSAIVHREDVKRAEYAFNERRTGQRKTPKPKKPVDDDRPALTPSGR